MRVDNNLTGIKLRNRNTQTTPIWLSFWQSLMPLTVTKPGPNIEQKDNQMK